MNDIISGMLTQTKSFIGTSTELVFQSFNDSNADYYKFYFLLPAFLVLALLGIKEKRISALLIVSLLMPSWVNMIHGAVESISHSSDHGMIKTSAENVVAFIESVQESMPAVIMVSIAIGYIIVVLIKKAFVIFHLIILILYYKSILYPQTDRTPPIPSTLLSILITLPIIAMVFFSGRFNKFAASVLFGFTGVWGLLQLYSSKFGPLTGRYAPNTILDELFSLSPYEIRDTTAAFIVLVALSVFCQYTLDTLYRGVTKSVVRTTEKTEAKHIKS